MPTFTFKANDTTFKGGTDPSEHVVVVGPTLEAEVDEYGVFHGRPPRAELELKRDLANHTGDLVLLRIAVESQVWNNRDEHDSSWPTATVEFDRQDGSTTVKVHKSDLKRIVVDNWELEWEGQGPNKLNGTAFTETLKLHAYQLQRTTLVGQPETAMVQLT